MDHAHLRLSPWKVTTHTNTRSQKMCRKGTKKVHSKLAANEHGKPVPDPISKCQSCGPQSQASSNGQGKDGMHSRGAPNRPMTIATRSSAVVTARMLIR